MYYKRLYRLMNTAIILPFTYTSQNYKSFTATWKSFTAIWKSFTAPICCEMTGHLWILSLQREWKNILFILYLPSLSLSTANLAFSDMVVNILIQLPSKWLQLDNCCLRKVLVFVEFRSDFFQVSSLLILQDFFRNLFFRILSIFRNHFCHFCFLLSKCVNVLMTEFDHSGSCCQVRAVVVWLLLIFFAFPI